MRFDALRRLEAVEGVLVSVKDSLDTSTPIARFARTMMLAIAELELERTRRRLGRSPLGRSIANGVSRVLGRRLATVARADKRFELNLATAPVVRELFRRRAAGESWKQLCGWLDTSAPRETGAWTHQAVSTMIKSRTYLGETAQGAIVNTEAHEPLVSPAEWQAAQSTGHRPDAAKATRCLPGFIRCAGCGFVIDTGGRR
jgi:hypothetical protein